MPMRHAAIGLKVSAAAINPADFVSVIDNPYFALQPGTTFVYTNEDGSLLRTMEVTHDTINLAGVTCVVAHDTSKVDGVIEEDTFDYFAQDKNGNVWYFGEDTTQFENGQPVGTEGTWHAGVNGATPGIIMEADPHKGDTYQQEHAAPVAEDEARVVNLTSSADVPYGDFHHLLKTAETTPLE